MSIGRNTVYGIIGNAGVAFSGFALNAFLTHALEKTVFGEYTVQLAFAGLFLPFMDLGLTSYYTVRGAELRDAIPTFFFRSVAIKTALVFLIVPFFLIAYRISFGAVDSWTWVLFVYLVFQSFLTGAFNVAFLPAERIGHWALRRIGHEGLLFFLVWASFYLGGINSVHILVALSTVASVIAVVAGSWVVFAGLDFHRLTTRRDVLGFDLRQELKRMLPFTVFDLLLLFYYRSNVMILSFFADERAVADYRVVFLAGQMVLFVQKGFSHAVAPRLALYHTKEENTQFNDLLSRGLSVVIFYVALFLSWSIPCGSDALAFAFGKSYMNVRGLWTVMTIATCLLVVQNYFAGLMNFLGHEKVYTMQSAIAFGIGFLLSLLLVPSFGVYGVLYPSLISAALLCVLNYSSLRHLLGIRIFAQGRVLYCLVPLVGAIIAGQVASETHVILRSLLVVGLFLSVAWPLGGVPLVLRKYVSFR